MASRSRRRLRLVALAAVAAATATAAAGCGGSSSTTTTTSAAGGASCAKSSLTLVKSGQLTIGTDNPAYGPWYGGGGKRFFLEGEDPPAGEGGEGGAGPGVWEKSRLAPHTRRG